MMSPPDDDAPHYLGHRDRLRAHFTEVGGDPLPDYELLELILFRSIPRRDVKPIAKDILKRFGSFAEALAAPPQRLMEVDGVGESVATDLKIVAAAARRLTRGAVAKRPILSSWNAVLDHCRTAMAFADREQFRLLFLDKRNALIADEVQQSGTVDHTPVYPARGGEARPRALRQRRDPRPQPPLGRPDPVRRRHRHDARDHRRPAPSRSASRCTTTSSSAATATPASRGCG